MKALSVVLLASLVLAVGLTFALTQRRAGRRTTTNRTDTGAPSARDSRTKRVGARGDFQKALQDAQPGDTIILEAGATYTGPFTLPFKQGTGTDADWITIRTSADEDKFPAPNQRITPAHAPLMPKLVAPGQATKALQAEARAHHYRFIGVEFAPVDASADVRNIIWLGEGNETSTAQMPHHIILDRCFIHGFPSSEQVRAVAFNGLHMALINSHISEIHHSWQDSQAVWGAWGPGPYLIENNYLEAAGENIIFGGDDPRIEGLIPSDIVIRRNHVTKPWRWREGHASYEGRAWVVKNLLEIKNGQRVLIEGNLFENSWKDEQTGVGILLKATSQYNRAPWTACHDITLRHNIIRHVGSAIQIAESGTKTAGNRRIHIINNLSSDISRAKYAGGVAEGYFISTTIEADEVTVEHNTVADVDQQTARIGYERSPPRTGLYIRNNIWMRGLNGWGRDIPAFEGISGFRGHIDPLYNPYYHPVNAPNGRGYGAYPDASIDRKYVYERNLMFGEMDVPVVSKRYPPGNFFVKSVAEVGFVNYARGNYRLGSNSPFKRRATDGRDLGCDIDALEAAMSGSNSGQTPAPSSEPPATATPSTRTTPPAPAQRPRRVNP